MKKLLLVLSAIFVSVMGWAQLNPYAYGLSSDWDATNQTLTVDFKLNAKANKIEIFAVDRANNNKTYKIHEITSPGNTLDYSIPIHINGKDKNGTCLPTGKNLTFAVKVDGTASNNPGTPVYIEQNRPYSPHGVAVNNHQNSQDFGAVYVTECTNGVSGNATWGWLSDKGKSLLKYNPRLGFESSYRKSSAFSDRATRYLEPHRVVVSDDGRVFVSSYNTNTNGKTAVWEFNPQTGAYTEIVKHDASKGERVVAIDVKGSGNNIKMLVCYYYRPASGNGYGWYVCEYTVGAAGSIASLVGIKCQYFTTIEYYKNTLVNAYNTPYFTYQDGFFDVAYGAKNESTVYMGLDYFINLTDASNNKNRTSLIYFNAALNPQYQYHNRDGKVEGEHWGGGGIVTWLDHNGNERIAMGGNKSGSNNENDGCIQIYTLNASNVPSTKAYNPIQTNTRKIINDLAIDCANNLYAVSFTDGANSTNTGSGTLLAVPMPYSGTVTTYCPTSNADNKEYFQLPARTSITDQINETDFNRIVENNLGGCGCDISLDRPMQTDMFNTICLPFDLDVKNLATNHPYYNATVLAFDGVTISTSHNESILELNFVSTDGVIEKNTPYLIQPQNDIPDEVSFDNVMLDEYTGFSDPIYQVTKDNITFWGIIPQSIISSTDPENEVVLILVADNRLANVTTKGTYRGFRGFFYFDRRNVPANVGARIAERKSTPTSLINLNSEQVDVEKFLREGRVYIRVGEALYTLGGQKVE